jgi:hypothetical protein
LPDVEAELAHQVHVAVVLGDAAVAGRVVRQREGAAVAEDPEQVGDLREVGHHPGPRCALQAAEVGEHGHVRRHVLGAVGESRDDRFGGGAPPLARLEAVVLGLHAAAQGERGAQRPFEVELAGVEGVGDVVLAQAHHREVEAGRVGRVEAVVELRQVGVVAVVVAVVVDVQLVHHHRRLHRVVVVGL